MKRVSRALITRRGVSNVFIALLAAALTAVSALVAEDLLPAKGDGFKGPTTTRVVFCIVLAALLVAAVGWRTWLSENHGTLYYLRVLEDSMEDWHESELQRDAEGRLDHRAVTRWVDLGATAVPDVRATVRDVST